MFKRRKPLTLTETAQQAFWPSMGWRRAFTYIKYRLVRLSDSSHSIGLGISIGMGVSFTPLLGTHFLQAAIIAWLLRANVFSAMIGTFIGNPWTFPFFWWAGFETGAYLFSFLGIRGAEKIPHHMTFDMLWNVIQKEPLTLFLPWLLGGYILLAVCIPVTYPVFFYFVKGAKIARAKAIARKRKKYDFAQFNSDRQ
ncbi:MAG: DUF2062 domain-containing protein [Alphaproteobacteria bacterium]|nr:DUF2062 domain-containing protein [Alphaproteobacteria bacterium]